MPNSNAKRSEIPKKYQWKPEDIYKNDNAWEKAFAKTQAEIPKLLKFKGKLAKSAKNLKGCFEKSIKLSIELTKIYGYAQCKSNVDSTAPREKAMYDRAKMLATDYEKATAFIEPEIIKISESRLKTFQKKEKYLQTFTHYFDRLTRKKAHILSDKEEALLAQTGDILTKPTDIFEQFKTNVRFPFIKDETGKKIELNFTNFSPFRESKSRRVRKDNAAKFFGTLDSYIETFTSTIDFAVKRDAFIASARKYKSSLAAAMEEHYFDTKIYDNLIDTVRENLKDSLHKYVELRRKVLKLKKVHYYDNYNPLVPEFHKKYTYEQGTKEISEALKPLGEDYYKAFNLASNPQKGWVDLYPNKHKRDGAYASQTYGVHPYVLLNHQNTLNDVFTVAHEYGHALHFYLAEKNQPYIYHDVEVMSSETAAILNEELLLSRLLKKAKTKKEKLYLLTKRLENIRQTFFRQILFAEFEKIIHEDVENKIPLTADRLKKTYSGLIKKYYGSAFAAGEKDGVEWAYIPHFYYDFYVWKYAAGIAAAVALAKRITDGVPGASENYIKYLQAGSSNYTTNLLKKAGVDLSKKETILHVINLFRETIEEFDRVYFNKG